MERRGHGTRDAWGHSSWKTQAVSSPGPPTSGGPPTLPHLDFSPLAFRTVREDVSVVLSPQVVVKVTGAPGPVPTSFASAPSPINCHPLQGRDSVPRASHIGGAQATVSERSCTAFQAIHRTCPCSHLFCAELGKAAGSGGCFPASSPGRWLPPLAVSPDGPWRPSTGLMCPSTYLVHLSSFSISSSFPPLPRLLLPSDCPWGGLKVPLGRRPGPGGWLPPRWGRRGRKGAGVALSPRATPVSLGRLGDQECGEGACSLQGGDPIPGLGELPSSWGTRERRGLFEPRANSGTGCFGKLERAGADRDAFLVGSSPAVPESDVTGEGTQKLRGCARATWNVIPPVNPRA